MIVEYLSKRETIIDVRNIAIEFFRRQTTLSESNKFLIALIRGLTMVIIFIYLCFEHEVSPCGRLRMGCIEGAF